MLDFRRITLFCLEKRVSRHKMTIFSKTLGKAMAALAPPGYVYASHAETCSLIKTLVHPTKKLFHCTQNRDDHGAGVTEWTPARVWSFGRSSIQNRSQGGFTQKPVMAYETAYGQWQPSRSHMQQEHRNHQPRQSGLLKPSGVRRKFSWGGFIQWHMVVICIWCTLFVTSEFEVIFTFTNQRCGEVDRHNMHILLHALRLFYVSLH